MAIKRRNQNGAENAGQDIAGQDNDGHIVSRYGLRLVKIFRIVTCFQQTINTNKNTLTDRDQINTENIERMLQKLREIRDDGECYKMTISPA